MPEQSKNDIPDDGLFLNLLTRVLEIIKSKPFANMDEDELSLYADYVQYRAQRDLFELFEDVSGYDHLGEFSADDARHTGTAGHLYGGHLPEDRDRSL